MDEAQKAAAKARQLSGLKPYKKGQSGNPKGRTPGFTMRPWTERYRKQGEELLPEKIRLKLNLPEGATYADGAVRQLFNKAMMGDNSAIREIADRVEGHATQRTEISTPENKAVTIRVVYDEEKK